MGENKLNAADLGKVSGGKIVGTTSYGYPVDDKGNVTFKDKTGESVVLTKDQWEKLLSNYTHTGGNPEAYLKDVPIKELKEAGLIPANPLGI
ncbi:MAG: hypothetical protein IKS87_05620 [Lachnospiraceae bacterium]|nr:hypothetical protein [Lachnospiraceae bacterium]